MKIMYKIIIVDDEYITANNISSSISWNEYGFENAEVFSSAAAALEFMNDNTVDCVISDIRMPVINGLDFAKTISEKFPNTVMVLISAYENFEYAQIAMEYGVIEYIVKPVTFSKLEKALKRIRAWIEKQNNYMLSDIHYRKRKIAAELISGKKIDADKLSEQLKKVGIIIERDLSYVPVAIVKFSVNNFEDYIENVWTHEPERFYTAFEYVVESQIRWAAQIQRGYNFIDMLWFSEWTIQNEFIRYINETANKIVSDCFDMLNCDVEYKLIHVFESIEKISMKDSAADDIEISNIIRLASAGEMYQAIQSIENVFSENIKLDTAKVFAYNLIIGINNHINFDELNISIDDELSQKTVVQIKEYVVKMIEKYVKFCHREKNGNKNVIETVKEYIENHYKEEITLSILSTLVYISESHLSRSFKAKTGESIIDFIAKIRLSHAKELLLLTDKGIDDIAYEVGYKTRNLFYKNFKSKYGVTPKRFRELKEKIK